MPPLKTRCCIAGGGPAGMMLGLLLARAGTQVVVLEKHENFLRDFRGDTVHPSTLDVLHELGLLEAFLARPHDEARELSVYVGSQKVRIADFSRLSTRCGFIVLMPQWDFLDFLRDAAVGYPGFRLMMEAKAEGLLQQDGRVCGLRVSTREGPLEIQADLVVAADGRHSTLREAAGLEVRNLGAPIDVLWMRIAKHASDESGFGGRIGAGRFMALLDRGSYWQCAYVIRKGGIDAVRERGLDWLRRDLAQLVPMYADGRLEQDLRSWDDVKLLTVTVDRLQEWCRPGLLVIGDAAHAMSPVGGVGINLAIQDAVAAANLFGAALADPAMRPQDIDALLPRLQQRRMFPTRVTQAVQVLAQERLIGPLLERSSPPGVAWPVKLLDRFASLRTIPAYAVGVGARPEHVRA
jgi:2-polyprenyl-6-methoxyphenol hydroxylase-like FAD-dependent oxidoreductase